MTRRIREFNWASTSLGPTNEWPQSLRTAVGICMNSPFPLFVWWGPELINIYNDAYAPVLGKRHPAALGQSARSIWSEIWPVIGEDVDRVIRNGEAIYRERVRLVMERNGYPEETFYTYAHSPIPDEHGNIIGLFQVCSDETARVQAELARDALFEKQAEATHRAKIILDSITDAFFALDKRWRFTYVNPQAERTLNCQPGELIGRVIWEEYQLAGTSFESAYREAANGTHQSMTAFYPPHQKWYEVHAYPSPEGISVYFRNVTDSVRLQEDRERALEAERAARSEAERASKMKDEFLATLSHELRTPLNAILGWSQVLRMSREPEDLAEGLDIIDRNARAQAQIVEDLLDMSRIISGKVRLDVQRVHLAAIVQAAVETARPTADAKEVRLQSVIDPLHDVVVSGDNNRLQQIMWNLLSNAIKFTPRGGRVQVLLERVNSHLEISVIDTGEGIPSEFLPFVFDRFRQADASTTRRHGGLGLGLSIVKQLVELHGGSVRVKSAGPDMGSTFIVHLPLTILHPETSPEAERRHPRGDNGGVVGDPVKVDLKGLRALVVDDEPDARALVKRLLEDRQAIVTTASSVGTAMKELGEGTFDVLVSDIGMPVEDGYALIHQVRSMTGNVNQGIPAIALTAYARAQDRIQAIAAGFLMHITKPVEPTEMIMMVAAATNRIRRGPNHP